MRFFAVLFVSLSVLAVPAMAGHHKSGEGKPARFAKIDTDGDGVISRDEFMARAAKRFAKMDANGDGRLSKNEMRRAYKKHHND